MSLLIPTQSSTQLTILFVVCSIVSYAITEIFKPLTKYYIPNSDLRIFAIRLLSCFVGALAGYSLSKTAMGFWVGFGSGSTNTYVVDYLKNKFSTKKDGD